MSTQPAWAGPAQTAPAPARRGSALPARPTVVICAVAAVVAAVSAVLAATDLTPSAAGPVRLAVVALCALLTPGPVVAVALRIPRIALAVAVSTSVSLAVWTLAAQLSMVWGLWSPLRTQLVLSIGTMVLCALVARTATDDRRPCAPMSGAGSESADPVRRRRALAGLVIAGAAFIAAARGLDTTTISATGLLGRLTTDVPVAVMFFGGLAVLCLVLADALRAPRLDPLVLGTGTLLLIGYCTGVTAAATGQTPVPTAFVHRGFVAIIEQGQMLPASVDARFSWAGFFTLGAHLSSIAGGQDVAALMVWAPLVFGALGAFALYAIASALTGSPRTAWLSVVIYQLFNWYQQDYFAPQAVAVLYYTTVLAVLLWQLHTAPSPTARAHRIPARIPGRVPGYGAPGTLAMGTVLLLLITALTVTHQITPMLLVAVLAVFAACGATRYRTLWLAAALIFIAWFSYGATDYWVGHLHMLFGELGQVGAAVDRGLSDRLTGDAFYLRMQYLRMGASAMLVAFAAAGWWSARRRRWALPVGLSALAPFGLVAVQSYGGEMILRSFLLASPLLAPLAAIAVAAAVRRSRIVPDAGRPYPGLGRRSVGLIATAAILTATATVQTVNRGLNAGFETTTGDQLTVSDAFIAQVPPDTTIMTIGDAPHTTGPRRTLDPAGPRLTYVDSSECLIALADCVLERSPDYLYITSQGLGMLQLQHGLSQSWLDTQFAAVAAAGPYVQVARGEGIEILRRTDAAAPTEGAR